MADTTGKKKKKKNNRIASLVVLLVALGVLIFALWRLIPILNDYRQTDILYDDLAGEVVDLGNPDRSDTITDNDYGDTYDWASVTIDFDALKAINSDVIGWIRFDNTDTIAVDYPILYDSDNSTYLRTDLYGDYRYSGSIFLEATDSPDFSDIYNILYGHNMRNGSMFGTLRRYRDREEVYPENRFFTVYTPEKAYRYLIFAYGNLPADSDIYMSGFDRNASYQQLINRILEVTSSDTGVVPTIDDNIMALSTCTSQGEDYRFVVFGMCIATYTYDQ